jgi:hypothetical protein
MDANTATGIAIAVAATSEIIALSPLKSNSIIQLVIQVMSVVFPRRR